MRLSILGMVLVALIASCSPSRFVKPLKEKEKSVGAHLGGQMINFSGLVIPIPYTSVTGGYGIKDDLTGFASLHLTDLAYQNIHLEAGAVKQLYSNADSSLGITVTPQLNFVYGMAAGEAKLWPQLDANAYWHYKKGNTNFAYAGVSNWFELTGTRSHGENQPTFWVPNFQLGHQFTGKKSDFFVEAKYIAPFSSNRDIVLDYWKPLNMKNGAVGLYLGFRKRF